LAKKISHWESGHSLFNSTYSLKDYKEKPSPACYKRVKHNPKISHSQIISVAHKVLVEGQFQKDVAREFRITPARVSQIVKKVSSNKSIFREMEEKEEER